MKLYKRWLLFGIIHSQTIQAESSTRGSFSFSLTCFLMIMNNSSLGECEFFFRVENCKQLYCAHCLDALLKCLE